MSDDELFSILRLQKTPYVGDVIAKKLIRFCGSAQEVFLEKKDNLLKIDGVGTFTIQHLWDNQTQKRAERELNYIRQNNVAHYYFEEDAYPKFLKYCQDSPILLFSRGNIDLSNQRIISIVGTRDITPYGRLFCESLIEDLAPLNPVIVSGFAYGVDICAQRAALDHQLQTIGCLAHGINETYPKAHQRYAKRIQDNGGFFTEFWSSDSPERENFLKRNRIIAGLSEATIVIESAEKGGSLVTAEMANGYNRDVLALPGRNTDRYSVGCNNLIKHQKAHMLTSAADLIYLLNWELEANTNKNKGIQKQLFVDLLPNEKVVLLYLEQNGKEQLDSVALECQLPIHEVSSILLNLEMKGMVRPLPGKIFEII